MGATYYCVHCLTTFPEDADRCPNLSCGRSRPTTDGWGKLLAPGDLLDRHYQIGRPLAVGGAGITYLAREVDGSGEPVPPELAIKVLYTARATGPYLRRLANEAQILQELDHENIVKCRGFVQRAGHPPYLVTLFEYGGNLAQHVKRVGPLGPRVAAATLRQVLLALDVAHQRGVVHRDLKPDNVLLREVVEAGEVPQVRVADFGIAKITGGLSGQLTRVGTFLGTPEFAAPEQFRGDTPTPATDVFAAGTLLVFLLTGKVPFSFSHRSDLESAYREMLAALPIRLELPGASSEEVAILQDIVAHMGALDPDDRWTVHQVIARLASLLEGPERSAYDTLDLTNRGAPTREMGPRALRAAPTLDTLDDGLQPPQSTAPPRPSAVPTAKRPRPLPSPSRPPPGTSSRSSSTEPRMSPTSPPPSHPAPPPGGAGLVGVLAGLGAAGLFATVVGGGLLTVAVLAGTAWATGWFDASAPHATVRLEPVVIDVKAHRQLQEAPAWLGGDAASQEARAAVMAHLDGLGADIGRRCDTSTRVLGSLLIAADGEVLEARIDSGSRADCVAEALGGTSVPNPTGAPGRARVAFQVGAP